MNPDSNKVYNFYDVFSPIHFANKLSGLLVWSLIGKQGSSERKYMVLKKDICLELFVFAIIISVCVITYLYCPDCVNNVTGFSFVLLKYGNYLTIFTIIISNCVFKKRLMNVIQEISFVDNQIEYATASKINYSSSKRYALRCIFISYSVFVIDALLNILNSIQDQFTAAIFCLAASYVSTLLNVSVNCFFCVILTELTKRLRKINVFLDYGAGKFYSQIDSSKTLHSILKIYNRLLCICKEIVVIFQTVLLCKITVKGVFLVSTTFYVTSEGNIYVATPLVSFSCIFWILLHVLDICTIIYHFVLLQDEANKIFELVENNKRAVGISNFGYKQVELFSLQVCIDDVKFTIFGYFPLDWTLLHSMLAGIGTYLVILHQFRNIEEG